MSQGNIGVAKRGAEGGVQEGRELSLARGDEAGLVGGKTGGVAGVDHDFGYAVRQVVDDMEPGVEIHAARGGKTEKMVGRLQMVSGQTGGEFVGQVHEDPQPQRG